MFTPMFFGSLPQLLIVSDKFTYFILCFKFGVQVPRFFHNFIRQILNYYFRCRDIEHNKEQAFHNLDKAYIAYKDSCNMDCIAHRKQNLIVA